MRQFEVQPESVSRPVLAEYAPPSGAPLPPCLYLGSRGQRCLRPAVEDGLCGVHAGAARPFSLYQFCRRLAALILLVIFLWFALGDFLLELSRLLH